MQLYSVSSSKCHIRYRTDNLRNRDWAYNNFYSATPNSISIVVYDDISLVLAEFSESVFNINFAVVHRALQLNAVPEHPGVLQRKVRLLIYVHFEAEFVGRRQGGCIGSF